MDSWEPDERLIREAEEKIAHLEERIEKERTKVPSEEEWYSWSVEQRRRWAEKASQKQREKLSLQGWR